MVLVLHDTSELRGLTRQMTYQASHDALTGLVNRREFERRLQEALDSAQSDDTGHALCYLDLDHQSCQRYAWSHRWRQQSCARSRRSSAKPFAIRISWAASGGDEFALLLVGCPLEKSGRSPTTWWRFVNDHCFVWRDKIFNVGISIGLAEIGSDSGTIEDIMNSAIWPATWRRSRAVCTCTSIRRARRRTPAASGEIHWLLKLQGALRDE